MEGNFLSTYNNKIERWLKKIEDDPSNKPLYESEMAEYMLKCMPYVQAHSASLEEEVTTDNVFNCKETKGLNKKDIFIDYLVEVENMNIDRPIPRKVDVCPTCPDSNIFSKNP